MKRYLKEDTVGRVIFICASILVGILTLLTGISGLISKVATLKGDLARMEEVYISEQQEQLRADVNALVSRIEARQTFLLRKQEQDLANRVEESKAIAHGIHDLLQGKVAPGIILATIREAIRPVRFHDHLGYCFIINLQGEAILYPMDPGLEGTNFLTSKVGGIDKIFEQMLDLTTRLESGFLRYDWFKPGNPDGPLHLKLTYVSRSNQLGLIFGTGEYLDSLEELVRNSVIAELRNSWSSSSMDYYFLYQLHDMQGGDDFATMLLNVNRPDLEGQRISTEQLDAKGKAFRREFMEGIRKNGEAHVVYWYKKPDSTEVGRKLSYFKYYQPWSWIVARGVYLDRLDAEIAVKQQEHRNRVKREVAVLALIFLAGVALSLLLAYWFSRQVQTIFDRYRATRRLHLAELQELNSKLEAQSRTDDLTGIANRTHFNEQLEHQLEQANRYGDQVCLLLFDIDRFKKINDSQGHLVGDQVLQLLTGVIKANIRRLDVFARWGGEEFVILAPRIGLEQAMQMAEKLRQLLASHPFPGQLTVTCSFGVGLFLPGERTHDFLQRVDTALYQAKQQGRNCCVRALPPP